MSRNPVTDADGQAGSHMPSGLCALSCRCCPCLDGAADFRDYRRHGLMDPPVRAIIDQGYNRPAAPPTAAGAHCAVLLLVARTVLVHGWVDHTKYLWFRDEGWRAGAGSVTAGPLAWCVSLSWSIPSSRLPPTFDQLEVLILVDCSVNLVIPGRALHAKIPYLSIDCQLSTPPDSVLPAMRVDVFLWSYPSAQRAPELHRIAEGS